MATNASTPVSNPITAPSPDSTGPFNIGFAYIKQEDVKVTVNGVAKNINTDYTFSSATQITFNSAVSSGSTILFVRDTAIDEKTVDFVDGSVLTEADLDNNTNQVLFAQQELVNDYVKRDGSLTVTGNLVFEGATDNTNETTLAITDPTADRTITIPDVTGTVVTTGDTDTVSTAMLRSDIDIGTTGSISCGQFLANLPATFNHNVTLGNSHTDKIVFTGSVDSNLLPTFNGARDLGSSTYEWRNLFIHGTANIDSLIADTADIDGGSIDGATIGASSASTGAFTTISASSNVDFNGDLDVDGTTNLDATNVVGTLFITGNIQADNISIDGNTISTAAADLTLDSTGGTVNVQDNFLVSGTTNLNGDVTIGNASSDEVSFAASVSSGIQPLFGSNLDLGSQIHGWNYLYVNNLAGDSIVTSGTSTSDSKVYSAKRTEALFLRQDSTETLASNVAWTSNDTTVATTGAIDARVRGLITDVGGFRPIANEAAFPTTNPDPDDNAGTIVSITALSADRTASAGSGTANTGVLTTGFQTTAGTQVTINGCPNNQVFEQGFGLLVETTSTLNTYTFVRYVADTSNVATVAAGITNINSVANQIDKVEDVAEKINEVFLTGTNIVSVGDVAGKVTEIGLLGTAAVIEDMGLLGNSAVIADMATIADTSGLITNIGDVANIKDNVTAVDNNSANINAAVSNAPNINAAVSNAANINSAVSNAPNINSVVSNAANINTVAGQLGTTGSVTKVADDINSITNASNFLNNFLQLYLGEASSDPTVDGLGNVVTEGDIYFNSVAKRMRVFNGSVFQNLAEDAAESSKFATATFNTLYTASAGSNSIDLGGLAITGAVFLNESIATNRVSLGKGSGTFNLGGI